MQNEQSVNGAPAVTCPSCRATLTAGLRFCRMCGYRLGEGLEEFNETRRFDPSAPPPAVATANPGSRAAGPFVPPAAWGAAPMQPITPLTPAPASGSALGRMARSCHPLRMGWVGWLVITLAVLFAVGGGVKMMRGDRAGRAGSRQQQILVSVPREVDGFETADGGGVFIEGLSGPGTSVERAGMIGGDVIVNYDGQPVRDEAALRRLLAATPPGKAVEVVFIRDGETKRTTLNTAHERDYRGMEPIDAREGGRGLLGVDLGDRVRLPDSNVYGVELRSVNRNGPADLGGLKKDDVIVEFNGKPVRTPGDLRLRIYEAAPGSAATVVVIRGGQRMEINIKIGRSN